MDTAGRVHLGKEYIGKTRLLKDILGVNREATAIRMLVDRVLSQAANKEMSELAVDAIEINKATSERIVSQMRRKDCA